MATAHINIEDMEDGTVAVQYVFDDPTTDGFNPQSGAHRAAHAVKCEMDKLMTQVPGTEAVNGEPAVLPVGMPEGCYPRLVSEGGIPISDTAMPVAGAGVVVA